MGSEGSVGWWKSRESELGSASWGEGFVGMQSAYLL